MRKINTYLSLLLVFALLFISVPIYPSAEKSLQIQQNASAELQTANFEKVNPLYEHTLSLEDAREQYASIPSAASAEDMDETEAVCSANEAANYIRQAMVKREEEISFLYITPDYYDYYEQSELINSIFDLSLEETGVPTEGDYLRIQWGYWNCFVNVSSDDDHYYYLITYDILYYTTQEQEQAVSEAVEQILLQLELERKTVCEKVRAIYHYIVTTVTYDYDTLYEDSYTLKYTAYAALIDKTAICQGYAAALYRLLMEAGIPARIIIGTADSESHSWNIVQMGNYWYYADSTWESISYSEEDGYSWFLLGETNFINHTRNAEYQTEEFYSSYPIGSENYNQSGNNPVQTVLERPVISSLETSFRRAMTVKWNRNTEASGYQIQYFSIRSPRSYKAVTISKNTTVSKTLARLITGKRYYVRIRSYKTVSGTTHYSAWSNVKSLKITR